MKALPAYALRCEPPRGCGWWWEVYPTRRHWWSRRVTRRFRGPFWPPDDISGGPGRWMSEDQFEDYGNCFSHLERHEIADSFRWRGLINEQV